MTMTAETLRRQDGVTPDAGRRTHLTGEIYTSPEVAERERTVIFGRHWLMAARAEELAKVGDYMTLDVAGESVVIARDSETSISAFMNVCLHRGAELVQGCGNARKLSCPYHSWSYDMAGRLLAAPRAETAGFDPKGQRLDPVRTAQWRGWVFINLDPNGESFEDFIRQWDEELWYYRADKCRLAFKTETIFACNWKYVVENVMDYYHAQTVHFASFGKQFDFSAGPLPLKEMPKGGASVQFDTKGRINDPLTFPRLPWLEDRPDFGAGKAAIFPNINLFSNTESIRTSTFWPVDENHMKLVLYFLLPEDAFAVEDYEAKRDRYRAITLQIAGEDKEVMESLQRNSKSAHFKPGPIVDLETPIRHMQDYYLSVMNG
ncbi:MAG: hypothetical protein JWO33_207 [Caulobacteraceae bacterium]|nr:hypothetical protein [Caulobacteraceae bacterium]